ncbi:ABC transporter permease, partial [Cytophagaceae bacterium YF14B1]
MLGSYLKIGLRNLVKNKVYSAINIGGLAVGMAVVILISLWINDELSFNRYHTHYDRIGMIRNLSTNPHTGLSQGSEHQPIPMAEAIRHNYRHLFDKVVLAWSIQDYTLNFSGKNLKRAGEFIEPQAPAMLSLRMLKGSHSALADPHSVILSQTTAEAIFGTADPINQNLRIDNNLDVKVTGVYEDLPKNSRFSQVGFFAPWALWVSSNEWVKTASTNWGNTSFHIYVERRPQVNWPTVQAGIKSFYLTNSPEEIAQIRRQWKSELFVHPMSDW